MSTKIGFSVVVASMAGVLAVACGAEPQSDNSEAALDEVTMDQSAFSAGKDDGKVNRDLLVPPLPDYVPDWKCARTPQGPVCWGDRSPDPEGAQEELDVCPDGRTLYYNWRKHSFFVRRYNKQNLLTDRTVFDEFSLNRISFTPDGSGRAINIRSKYEETRVFVPIGQGDVFTQEFRGVVEDGRTPEGKVVFQDIGTIKLDTEGNVVSQRGRWDAYNDWPAAVVRICKGLDGKL